MHIRLHSDAVNDDSKLHSLKDYIAENSGSCLLFIHLSVLDGETVKEKIIKVHYGINSSENIINELKKNVCVEEVWRR